MNNMKYDNMKYNIGVVSCYQYPSTLTYLTLITEFKLFHELSFENST